MAATYIGRCTSVHRRASILLEADFDGEVERVEAVLVTPLLERAHAHAALERVHDLVVREALEVLLKLDGWRKLFLRHHGRPQDSAARHNDTISNGESRRRTR
jgi:hypothetical protein